MNPFARRNIRVDLGDGWVELYTRRADCKELPDGDAFIRTTLAAMTKASDIRADGGPLDLTTTEGWAQLSPEARSQVYAKVRQIVAGWKDPAEVRDLCG